MMDSVRLQDRRESLISSGWKMEPSKKKVFLEALRSGDYKHGRECLITHEGGYCCLGVYNDLFGEWEGSSAVGGSTATLNKEQIPYNVQVSLYRTNDSSDSFEVVADLIEECL